MALQFSNVREDLFSRGIDARSAENQIPEGFVRDSLNAEIVQKYIRKRPGVSGYAGNLPVRVESIEYNNTDNQICFTLNEAVDLLSVRSSPIVVHGRLSKAMGAGPFTQTSSSKYYPGFFQNTRQTFTVGTGSLSIPASEHGMGTSDIFLETVESLSATNLSNQLVDYDALVVDTTTDDLSVQWNNQTGSPISVFTYYLPKPATVGSVYVGTLNHTGSGVESFSIPAATHQLSNFQIVPRLYLVSGTDRILTTPESLTINTATGMVTVGISATTASSYVVILSAAPAANLRTGQTTSPTYTITLAAPDSPFIFPAIYADDDSGTIELVKPDVVSYDSSTDEITVVFQNPPSSVGFRLYWEYGTITSNTLCVTDATVTVDDVDTNPQMSIWGLDHAEIWKESADRGGWVQLLDSYRIAGEQRIVAGLGGVLHSAQTFSEAGINYLYGSLYPRLFARVAGVTVLAPVLWETGEAPGRTRGYITGDDLQNHWATITSVQWDSGVAGGTVRYNMTIPNLAMFEDDGTTETTVTDIISVDDDFTAEQMGFSRLNGTFRIKQVTRVGNTLSVWCQNPRVDSADWDDNACAGRGGIFTDKLVFQSIAPFLPGDKLLSEALPSSLDIRYVRGVTGSTVSGIVSGLSESYTIQSGVQLTATRTSRIIPLRDGSDNETTENVLRGDTITQSETQLPLRVVSVNPDSTASVSITSDGILATVVVSDTASLRAGQYVQLLHAGVYTGEHLIQEVVDGTSFTFASEETDTETGLIVGHCIEVGEPVPWTDLSSDANTFDVTHRFIPVESPDDNYSLTPGNRQYYFNFSAPSEQRLLRSVMVQDNLYMTNHEDAIMKYDGVNLYRAGLLPWQPGAFIYGDTSASNPIVLDNPTQVEIVAGGDFDITSRTFRCSNAVATLNAGDRVTLPGLTGVWTLRQKTSDSTHTTYVIAGTAADNPLTGMTTGTVRKTALFQYYYRLDAVDANNNRIVSAMAQSEDYKVEIDRNAGIRHRLIGLPAFDNYDYDRIYLRVYRTQDISDQATAPTFYLVHQQRISFSAGTSYIDFTDSLRDSNLFDADFASGLIGGELGINWDTLPRAKHITSSGGTLLLGNVRGFDRLSLQLFGNAALASSSLNNHTVEFQRDYNNPSTVSDPQNTLVYQWRDVSTALPITTSSVSVGTSWSFTIASAPAVGDWVFIDDVANSLERAGWWQVAAVSPGPGPYSVTVNSTSAATAPTISAKVYLAGTSKYIPVPIGSTVATIGSVNGNTTLTLFQAARRLAIAINATQRLLGDYVSGFQPWLMARGGNDIGESGLLYVTNPVVSTLSPSVEWNGSSAYSIFINDVERSSGDVIPASTPVFPSRVLVGYRNYPELIDNPWVTLDGESDSAIDINPSDGQEITGLIPFFGDAAFGAAQQSAITVVFKQNSIYLIDINEKRAGRNAVQRIETEGIGCTYPNSVSITKNGIIFAHESGIYALRKNLSVEYVGKFIDRKWKAADRSEADLIQGHHYTVGRQYKLVAPQSDGSTQVYVYDHTNEAEAGGGSWGRYQYAGLQPVGWCNLSQDAYMATTSGRVFVIRRRGDKYDYQDDHSAIQFFVKTRPLDFGVAGVRKVLESVTGIYRTEFSSDTEVGLAIDTEQEYDTTTPVLIKTPAQQTGIDDRVGKDVYVVKHSMKRRKGVLFSLTVSNELRLEGVDLTGVEFRVGLYGSGQGITQAADTRKK